MSIIEISKASYDNLQVALVISNINIYLSGLGGSIFPVTFLEKGSCSF